MARILWETGNYDEVWTIAERILAIDPDNDEAKGYINFIKQAEKNKDWRRLKDARDIGEYVREYYEI